MLLVVVIGTRVDRMGPACFFFWAVVVIVGDVPRCGDAAVACIKCFDAVVLLWSTVADVCVTLVCCCC